MTPVGLLMTAVLQDELNARGIRLPLVVERLLERSAKAAENIIQGGADAREKTPRAD